MVLFFMKKYSVNKTITILLYITSTQYTNILLNHPFLELFISNREYKRTSNKKLKWAGLDSNQRSVTQRIYNPPPLTTRTPTPKLSLY